MRKLKLIGLRLAIIVFYVFASTLTVLTYFIGSLPYYLWSGESLTGLLEEGILNPIANKIEGIEWDLENER